MAQVFVYADSLQDHVVAVVVPDPEKFAGLVTKVTGTTVVASNVPALLAASLDPRVNAAVLQELAGYGDRAKLNGFEKIKAIFISLEPFTMENDLLTPTFKTKRYTFQLIIIHSVLLMLIVCPEMSLRKFTLRNSPRSTLPFPRRSPRNSRFLKFFPFVQSVPGWKM